MLNAFRRTTRGMPAAFWLLWFGTLVNRVGLFVVPFLTFYLTRERDAAPEEATLIVGLLGFGSFVSALIGGVLADRIGRKPTFVGSMALTAMMLLLLGLAREIWLIGLCALVLGLVSDLYRPAISAMITDIVPQEDRTRAFSLIDWAINLGSAVAPVIAGYAVVLGYGTLFVADAVTTLVFGLLVWWRVAETRPSEAVSHSRRTNPFVQFGAALRDFRLVTVTVLALCVSFMIFQAYSTLPLAMEANGLSETQYGTTLSLNGLIIIFISIPVAAWAARRHRYRMIALATVLFGVGFGSHAFADGSMPIYMLGVAIWTLGELTVTPVSSALVSDLAPVALRGTYMGVFGTAWGLGSAIGPIIGGLIFARAGSDALWTVCFVVGMLAAGGWWMAGRAFAPRPAQVETIAGDEPRPA